MHIKTLLFVCTTIIISIVYQPYDGAKPPFLKHSKNSCWNDSAIWLLYNMPEFVDKLIENKAAYQEYEKENTDLLYLSNLFEAMRNREKAEDEGTDKNNKKELDEAIENAKKIFHQNIACPLTKKQYGDFGDATWLFMQLIRSIPFSKELISNRTGYVAQEDTLVSRKTKSYQKYYDDVWYDPSPFALDYFFLTSFCLRIDKKIEKTLTFTEIDDEDKQTGNTYTYEFIGMIIGGYGHTTAYIKDQREKGNPWYYCNDSSNSCVKAETKEMPLPLDWNSIDFKENAYPLVLLYKKLPNTHDVDTFAQALRDIAKF